VKLRVYSARLDRARLIYASACIDTAETGGLVREITAPLGKAAQLVAIGTKHSLA